MNKTKLTFLCAVLVFISSCTHYAPVRFIGKGKASDKTIGSCSDYVLGIPLSAENITFKKLTHEEGLTEKDIHSFDISTNYILYPIYYNTCFTANLTKRGEKVTKHIPNFNKKLGAGRNDNYSGFYMDGDKKITTLKGCNRLSKLSRIDCKKAIRRK